MPRKKISSSPPAELAAVLVDWFRREGRDYPWRRTRDPYAVLVSEIMLQQTQITTVLERGYYIRWMERFPDFRSLAAADEDEVLKAWEGLGYYRRARNLHRLARVVVAQHAGCFPREIAEMLALPGIGRYTAGAVASFAFDQNAPLVDGNVARVLMRLHDDHTPADSTAGQAVLWERAAALIAATSEPRLFNSALMELGQTHCRAGVPECACCPVSSFCAAEDPASLPVKQTRAAITEVTERVFFLEKDGAVLLEQERGSRRTGMWKLPALPCDVLPPPVLVKTTYGITRYKVTLWVHQAPAEVPEAGEHRQFFDPAALDRAAMPSPYRKALASAREQLRAFALA
jgi:A/G-specific adenine glycosylase